MSLRPAGTVLVVQTHSGETSDKSGPAEGVYTVPAAGGALHVLGILPAGLLSLAGNVAYYVTNADGDVYAIQLDNGAPQHVARHVVDRANGIAAVDGAVIVIGRVGLAQSDSAIRVDLKTGAPAAVTLSADQATTSDLLVARAGDATLVASELAGTTLKINAHGEIAALAAPPGPLDCIAATATTVWWFRQTLASQQPGALPELFSAPITGGPPVQIADPRTTDEASVGCAANDRELFYTKGHQILARAADGKTRLIAATQGELSAIGADNAAVYWSEKLPLGTWSVRSAPVR